MSIYVVTTLVEFFPGGISAVNRRKWSFVYKTRKKADAIERARSNPTLAAVFTSHDGAVIFNNEKPAERRDSSNAAGVA